MLQIVQAYAAASSRSAGPERWTDLPRENTRLKGEGQAVSDLNRLVQLVMVNDHTAFRTDWMPFAGRRQSGYGIGGIPWSMREMTEENMVVLRHAY